MKKQVVALPFISGDNHSLYLDVVHRYAAHRTGGLEQAVREIAWGFV